MSKLNGEKVRVKCTRPDPLPDGTYCEYAWGTRSRLRRISCPNCGYPNDRDKMIERAQQDESKKKEEVVPHEPAPAPAA